MPPVWNGLDLADLYSGAIDGPLHMDAYYLSRLFFGPAGDAYGLDANGKIDLFNKFTAHLGVVEGHTGNMKLAFMCELILALGPEIKGDLVECGAFKGSSAISLSHVAAATNRRLIVCDSFEGLPPDCEPQMELAHHNMIVPMKPGDFTGTRDEVEANIRRFGLIERVTFIEGFFDTSLKALRDPIAFAFIDVDLISSTRDCLRAIWPLLSPGGVIVTDDAPDLNVAKVYFDDVWWRETLGCDAPGLIGAGCGARISHQATGQGYCRKPAASGSASTGAS